MLPLAREFNSLIAILFLALLMDSQSIQSTCTKLYIYIDVACILAVSRYIYICEPDSIAGHAFTNMSLVQDGHCMFKVEMRALYVGESSSYGACSTADWSCAVQVMRPGSLLAVACKNSKKPGLL